VNLLLNVINALVARIKRDEEGQTIVEYALVLGGVSLALIIALVAAGLDSAFAELVSDVADQMNPN
jgi:Flp pilus assembly pilin Flp